MLNQFFFLTNMNFVLWTIGCSWRTLTDTLTFLTVYKWTKHTNTSVSVQYTGHVTQGQATAAGQQADTNSDDQENTPPPLHTGVVS